MHLAQAKLTIASGETESALLSSYWGPSPTSVALDNAQSLTITAPATLTGACTVEVSPLTDPDQVWSTLQDDGADVVPAAGKTIRLPVNAGFRDLRIVSADAEAADRDFYVSIQEELA